MIDGELRLADGEHLSTYMKHHKASQINHQEDGEVVGELRPGQKVNFAQGQPLAPQHHHHKMHHMHAAHYAQKHHTAPPKALQEDEEAEALREMQLHQKQQQQMHQHQAKHLHKKHHKKAAAHHAEHNKVGNFEIVSEGLTAENEKDIQSGKHHKAVNQNLGKTKAEINKPFHAVPFTPIAIMQVSAPPQESVEQALADQHELDRRRDELKAAHSQQAQSMIQKMMSNWGTV